MKPQVIVCVFNNLATDQRVEKVCKTLMDDQYPVILVGNDWKGLPEMNRPYPFYRLKLKSKSLKTAYAEFQLKLYDFLKHNAKNRTIVLANDLDLLYACYKFTQKRKLPLVYDSHEIFTELPHIQGRFTQKIWRYLENKIIRSIPYMMTESESYAQWFVDKYGIKKPTVIHNFPRRNFAGKIEVKTQREKKIILYQGALNGFRGLDQSILAMHFLPGCEFWIVGDGPKRQHYEAVVRDNEVDNVKFFGNVSPVKLREITPQADVGLSLEENGGISYLYSLPNKVSDYVQGGVPIVGSDFPETKRIIETYGVGVIARNRDPKHIAEKIQEVLEKPAGFYDEKLRVAAQDLCWEVQENKILSLFQRACEDFNFL